MTNYQLRVIIKMTYHKIFFRLTVSIILILLIQYKSLAQYNNTSRLDSAKALLTEEKYDDSINLLNIILIDDSTNINAYYYLSVCYQDVSNFQKAAQALYNALLYKPDDIKIMVSLGNDLIASGRLSEANEILSKALTLDSTNSLILIPLGKVLMQKHNWAEAIKIYNRLIKIDSSNSYYYEQAGKCSSLLDDKDDAIVFYQIAHRLNPMNEQTVLELSQLYFSKSQLYSAMRIIDDGLAVYPSSSGMWSMRGKIYFGMKEYTDAIKSYKSSIQLGDSSLTNFKDIGICNYYSGDYDSSISYLNTAIKIKKDDPASFFYLGSSYKELKNYDAAIENLSTAKDLLKNDFTAEVYTQLGATYYSTKNYRKALSYYKDALREKPNKIELYFYLAVVYEHYYKDKSTAINYYQKFLADSSKTDKKLVSYAKERLNNLTEDNFMNKKK